MRTWTLHPHPSPQLRTAAVRSHPRLCRVLCLANLRRSPEGAQVARSIRVLGYGDPVMDVLAPVGLDYLGSNNLQPGGCVPIDAGELQDALQRVGRASDLLRTPGGSAANVMKGLAKISGGSYSCTFMGMAGVDATASSYRQQLAETGVQPLLLESPTQAPTATSICFITPDGQRTMRTCLGAALELTQPQQLPGTWLDAAGKLLHCEGYSLYRPQLTRHIMAEAKAAGAIVSIDLASFEVVERCGSSLLSLLQDGLLDVVFANEQECAAVGALLGLPAGDDGAMVEAVQQRLLQWCSVVVVSLGSRGCVARGAGGQVGQSSACRVTVQDTLAAGDYFSSGFLFGYLQGMPLQVCAACGCAAGAVAVQAKGAAVTEASWQELRCNLDALVQEQQQRLLLLQQQQAPSKQKHQHQTQQHQVQQAKRQQRLQQKPSGQDAGGRKPLSAPQVQPVPVSA